ncbi:MAG TPA: YihY family inner membrane protein [Burkholderiales bacterium]|jgi:membrane protein
MTKSAWRGAAEFLMAVTRRFNEDRAAQAAGSLTFTSLLSIVPLLTVALSLSMAFPVFDEAISTLQVFLFENFLPDAEGVETISEQILSFSEQASRLKAIGLAFLVVTSVLLMLTIDDTLNRIFRVRRRRPLAHKIITYWSVLTLWPVLIGASLSLTTYLIGNASMAARLVPFAFTWAALTMLYILVPYRHVDVRHAAVGAFLAGTAFEIAKRAFALYIANFPTYTLVYGAFATLPIFLLWMYISWLVVLAGAVFTAMLPGYRVIALEGNRGPGRELTEALDVLAVLSRAQDGGYVLPLTRIAAQAEVMPERCEGVLERCAQLGWVAKAEKDSWVLARDADTIRLADIYRAFVLDPDLTGERLAEHWKQVDASLGASLRQLSAKETAT